MEEMMELNGIYKDETREIPIKISEDNGTLICLVNGVKFKSTDLEEWILDESEEYTEEQLDAFDLSVNTYRNARNLVKEYSLKSCSFIFSLPQTLIHKETLQESPISLQIELKIGNFGGVEKLKLSFDLDNKLYEVEVDGLFENALAALNKKLGDELYFKNCYGCRYSSYNVYGQSFWGTLLCYKHKKDDFIKIQDKVDYTKLQTLGYSTVEETYCCDEFKIWTEEENMFIYKS